MVDIGAVTLVATTVMLADSAAVTRAESELVALTPAAIVAAWAPLAPITVTLAGSAAVTRADSTAAALAASMAAVVAASTAVAAAMVVDTGNPQLSAKTGPAPQSRPLCFEHVLSRLNGSLAKIPPRQRYRHAGNALRRVWMR